MFTSASADTATGVEQIADDQLSVSPVIDNTVLLVSFLRVQNRDCKANADAELFPPRCRFPHIIMS